MIKIKMMSAYTRSGRGSYEMMSENFDQSIAFKTACDLIFKGKEQPSGYTRTIIHLNRLIKKNLIRISFNSSSVFKS